MHTKTGLFKVIWGQAFLQIIEHFSKNSAPHLGAAFGGWQPFRKGKKDNKHCLLSFSLSPYIIKMPNHYDMKGDIFVMNNDITKLLGIKDSGIKVLSIRETSSTKFVEIERKLFLHYCPICNCRMYSKGIYTRKVNHPLMQDGFRLVLLIRQRRWQCCNPECKAIETDKFSFIERHRRNTNVSDILIVKAFKDPEASASSIARRFHVSTTHAITTFARYVDMPRRSLTEIICVDEVHLGISKQCKYALIIQDFATGEPLDMVISRRDEFTLPYFASIPLRERLRVEYLISDMYRPYQAYVEKYFPNAKPVVDAFHVIQLINREFLGYIRFVIREIDRKDREQHEALEEKFGRRLPFSHSRDYLILKKFNWMLLKNADDLKYYSQPRMNHQLGRMMNTYDYLEWLFALDSSFRERRNLKEQYVAFNKKFAGNPDGARKELPRLINLYRTSKYKMFREISFTLEEFSEAIINSFILSKRKGKSGQFQSRLSNGPMEALNRIPKDMKRIGRGYKNFEHIRNRFLYAQRKNAAILGSPKTIDEVLLRSISEGPIE